MNCSHRLHHYNDAQVPAEHVLLNMLLDVEDLPGLFRRSFSFSDSAMGPKQYADFQRKYRVFENFRAVDQDEPVTVSKCVRNLLLTWACVRMF